MIWFFVFTLHIKVNDNEVSYDHHSASLWAKKESYSLDIILDIILFKKNNKLVKKSKKGKVETKG